MEKNTKNFSQIKGLLVDLDGTLYFKGKAISRTVETVSKLRDAGFKLLFLTNTDSKSPKTILKILRDYGFIINIDEIFTPVIALKKFLSKYPRKKSYFVTTEEVENEFQDVLKVKGSELPDFAIIGDFHDNWDVKRLNRAFNFVFNGAKLLGMQGNRYYLDRNGEPVIDTGSFVQMIANAANVTPKIFGKPSKEYFLQALNKINFGIENVLVVGDDPETDIQGAINTGIKGILVKTGKGQYFESSKSEVKPFLVIDSFNYLLDLLLG